ncbi:MAG TPA: hypothetical protein VH592_21245 [Gemmataceae bacterium]|jgi:hypothetical protein
MKKTEQKILLSVELLEKLKVFALKVGAIREKETTWADLLRHAATSIVTKSTPEGIAKAMESQARLAQAARPATDAGEGKE